MNRYSALSTKTDPRVRFLFTGARRRKITNIELGQQSGVTSSTLGKWARGERGMQLNTVEACFNVIGYTLVPMPISDLNQHEKNRIGLTVDGIRPDELTQRILNLASEVNDVAAELRQLVPVKRKKAA